MSETQNEEVPRIGTAEIQRIIMEETQCILNLSRYTRENNIQIQINNRGSFRFPNQSTRQEIIGIRILFDNEADPLGTKIELIYGTNNPSLMITNLYVKPEYRREGLGKKMYSAVTNICEKLNCKDNFYAMGIISPGFFNIRDWEPCLDNPRIWKKR